MIRKTAGYYKKKRIRVYTCGHQVEQEYGPFLPSTNEVEIDKCDFPCEQCFRAKLQQQLSLYDAQQQQKKQEFLKVKEKVLQLLHQPKPPQELHQLLSPLLPVP